MAKSVVQSTNSHLPGSKYELSAENRNVFGRKLKAVRRMGILPGNVSGREIKSFSVQVRLDEFGKIFALAGETGVVALSVGGKVHPVLIHEVHRDYVSDVPLHVDFLEVNLKEKVIATVPIEIVGESPAEKAEEGVVVQQMHEVSVEALPTDLPEKIVVDISGLVAVDDHIKVSDLQVDRSKVEIQEDDPERIVVSVAAPAKVEEEPIVEETPAEGEVAPEGGASAEGGEQAPDSSEENKES